MQCFINNKHSVSGCRSGQSLMEILIGMAIGIIFTVGAATIIAPSLQTSKQSGTIQMQTQLGGELLNNVKAWTAGGWNNVLALATGTGNLYYLNTFATGTVIGTQSVQIGSTTYLRDFYLSDVYRASNGTITSTITGNAYDPSTKQITVVVSLASSTTTSTKYSMYITRNANNVFSQSSWSGGGGYTAPATFVSSTFSNSTATSVNGQGQIQLSIASSTNFVATGTLDSRTFDTVSTSGTQLNSYIWQGSASSGTSVQFQFATSNTSSGPWSFIGPGGTTSTYFSGGAGIPVSIATSSATSGYILFNGYRYIRYRVTLNADGTHQFTPVISQIGINWSP